MIALIFRGKSEKLLIVSKSVCNNLEENGWMLYYKDGNRGIPISPLSKW